MRGHVQASQTRVFLPLSLMPSYPELCWRQPHLGCLVTRTLRLRNRPFHSQEKVSTDEVECGITPQEARGAGLLQLASCLAVGPGLRRCSCQGAGAQLSKRHMLDGGSRVGPLAALPVPNTGSSRTLFVLEIRHAL